MIQSVFCVNNTLADLSRLLDKHAPLVTRTFTKQATGWLSDSYRLAKNIRRQLERIWRKDKSAYNRARLRKQIVRCNSLVNKDKANYFRNLVRENVNDSKKLWQVLRSALHSSPEAVLLMNLRKVLLTGLSLFSVTK